MRRRSTRSGRTPTTSPASTCPTPSTRPTTRSRRCTAPRSWCSRCRRRRCAQNLTEWSDVIPRDALLVSLMKGVELGSLKRMSEVIAEVTGAGPERIGGGQRPQPGQGDRQPGARRERGGLHRRGGREAAAGAVPLGDVPAVLQHRRDRLRAGRRLQERHRAVRRDGGRARLRRQHHRVGDHPRPRRDRPARDQARRRRHDPHGAGRAGRPRRVVLVAAVAQPHLRREARPGA